MRDIATLPKPFFVLAPMDDVTDTVFRQIISDTAAPDLYFTEFVNVDGLQSPGRPNLLKKLQFTDKEMPLIAQIWGKKPDNYYKTTKELIDMGFAGVDINMGCPVKKVVKDGCCSALIDNRGLAGEIIKATQEAAGDFPVSVKTRLGYREVDLSWIEFLLQQKLNMLTIHCRTVKQMSKVPAQWEYMKQIKELRDEISPTTLLVVNGDIMSKKHGEEIVQQYGLDGAMIGRGIFHDPYAFAEQSPWAVMNEQEKKDLYTKHVKLFAKTWKDSERRVQTLNKFCKVYINDFPGSSEIRTKLMQTNSTNELLELLR